MSPLRQVEEFPCYPIASVLRNGAWFGSVLTVGNPINFVR